MARSSDGLDDAMGSLAGLVIIVTVVAIVISAWLAVRAANSIISAFSLTPRSRMLWGGLASGLVLLLLGLATGLPLFFVLAGLAFVFLLITAQAVVLTHQPVFEEPRDARQFMDEVLTDWWPQAA